jgi:hypothetical protein
VSGTTKDLLLDNGDSQSTEGGSLVITMWCESKHLILYTGDSQSIKGGTLVIQSGMEKEFHGREGIPTEF